MDELTVTITFEDGSEVECELAMVFSVEGQEYAALVPKGTEEVEEVYLYRYDETDDEINLSEIEDDEEMMITEQVFRALLEEENGEDDALSIEFDESETPVVRI